MLEKATSALILLSTMLSLAASGIAQVPPSWTEPFPPHHIVGNVYYVGSKGLASYLITTSEGSILINSSLESSVPLIQSSVEKLGFRFNDIKILLISHAHWDHAAGSLVVECAGGRVTSRLSFWCRARCIPMSSSRVAKPTFITATLLARCFLRRKWTACSMTETW